MLQSHVLLGGTVGAAIPGLQDVGFQNLAFVVDSMPEALRETVDLHEDLVQVPAPLWQGAHPVKPSAPDLGGEHRAAEDQL